MKSFLRLRKDLNMNQDFPMTTFLLFVIWVMVLLSLVIGAILICFIPVTIFSLGCMLALLILSLKKLPHLVLNWLRSAKTSILHRLTAMLTKS